MACRAEREAGSLPRRGLRGTDHPAFSLPIMKTIQRLAKTGRGGLLGLTAVWLVWAGMGMAGAQDAPGSLKVPDGVMFEKGITYGTAAGQALLLDLAKPKEGAGPFPALVLVHGGGWAAGDRSSYHEPMLAWAKQGIVCVSVDYRLAPQFKFPCQIEDVKCAVRWVRANAGKYQVDADRIGALGGSAGAHLVGLLGTTSGSGKWEGEGGHAGQSSAVRLMVCHGIPSDLLMGYLESTQQREPESGQVRSILTNFLGVTPDQGKAVYVEASPVHYVSKTSPPALLLHGSDDPLVPVKQAEVFAAALEKQGTVVELVKMEGAGHGGFGKDPARTLARLNAFLVKHLLKP